MSKHNTNTMEYISAETNDISIAIGKIEENTQITTKDTGWSEEEKERMKILGYDNLDIVREWYS